jgi:hypothetical protein
MAWSELRAIVSDLTTLEVNTVLKQEITARKMPSPRIALVEIIEKYHSWLSKYNLEPKPVVHYGKFVETFASLRDTARRELDAREDRFPSGGDDNEAHEWLVIIHRIERSCENLVYLLEQLKEKRPQELDPSEPLPQEYFDVWRDKVRGMKELKLASDDIVKIRKVWDVGVERVVMQSIVQLDGDVLTRIVPKYASAENRLLHRIHQDGLDVSLSMWKELFATVRAILGLGSSESLELSDRDASKKG